MTSDDYPYWTYEELHDTYYYDDRIKYLMDKYMTSVDREDLDYPPTEYWESCVEHE